MEKVIIASNNMNKIREFSEMLGKDVQVLSLHDVGFDSEIDENGETFFDNALIKAKTISLFLREKGISAPVYADDSGLSVNALNGAPGVHSARYAGFHGDDKKNRDLLLKTLKILPTEARILSRSSPAITPTTLTFSASAKPMAESCGAKKEAEASAMTAYFIRTI